MVTIENLKELMGKLNSGQAVRVPYDAFEILFPPGVEDDGAKGAAYKLSRKFSLKIDNREDGGAVYFYKE